MASTVINNPESINDYRLKMHKSIRLLREQLQKTESAIQKVSESWKDQKFLDFRDEFNENKSQINSLCEILNKYADGVLKSLEEKLRNYNSLVMRLR